MSVDEIVNDITNHLSTDGSANYIKLIESLHTIEKVSSVILGLMVVVILLGIPIVVSVELVYINFPVAQEQFEKVLIKTTGNLNKALGLVLRDAKLAVLKANTIETGNNVNIIYLKLKIKSILIAVIAAASILGAGPIIVDIILSITQSLLQGFYGAL